MPEETREQLHERLKEIYNPEKLERRFTSTVAEPTASEEVDDLLVDDEARARMPFTRADYVIKEDPARVKWEREVRKFLGQLPRSRGHKVTGPMIFEWATGKSLKQIMEEEGTENADGRGGGKWGSANRHLRHINAILFAYFGKPYKTTILGRHVGKAYTVRPWFNIKLKQPACLTLLPEWKEGSLKP